MAEDICLVVSSAGIEVSRAPLSFDADGLRWVEEFYWRLAEVSDDETIATYERQMAIFLGECLIRSYGGEWFAYDGPESVFTPVVVRVRRTRLHHDVFLFCTNLRGNRHALGQRQHRALQVFLKAASHAGFA